MALYKYDAAGNFQWKKTYDGPAQGQDNGFEVTLVGAIASMLTHKDALGLTTRQAASAGTFYLVGARTTMQTRSHPAPRPAP